jgi:hypothetical protein
MGKTWHFIFDTVHKENYFLSRETKTKPEKVNNTGFPPVKRFFIAI